MWQKLSVVKKFEVLEVKSVNLERVCDWSAKQRVETLIPWLQHWEKPRNCETTEAVVFSHKKRKGKRKWVNVLLNTHIYFWERIFSPHLIFPFSNLIQTMQQMNWSYSFETWSYVHSSFSQLKSWQGEVHIPREVCTSLVHAHTYMHISFHLFGGVI